MTQKQKVLAMLRAAGSFGVRSDTYLAEFIPRAAARICELREDGWEITSEREHQFVRYTLVGSSAGKAAGSAGKASPALGDGEPGRLPATDRPTNASVASSETRSVPSMFDPDDCLDWGDAA